MRITYEIYADEALVREISTERDAGDYAAHQQAVRLAHSIERQSGSTVEVYRVYESSRHTSRDVVELTDHAAPKAVHKAPETEVADTRESSTYRGDAEHSIECTGDAVVGDEVCFERAMFSGSYHRPQFAGFERVTGTIEADSYGEAKQQHTFTIETAAGRIRIKGRNLYRNRVWRRPWTDETERTEAATEKHERGDAARAERDERRAIGY